MSVTDLSFALPLAESVEAEWMYAMQAGAAASAQHALGMSQHRIGGGVALSMTSDPTGGFWTKALGFGVSEPVTADLVEGVVDVYRRAGDRVATLQLVERLLPEPWDGIRARLGLERTNSWAKCLRPLAGELPEAPTDLRVGPVPAADLAAWARVLCAGFGMPDDPALQEFMSTGVTSDQRFHPWAAWDGETMVAAANLFVYGGVAALAGAATLQIARRRGAQSALTRQRLLAAGDLGETWASFETWIPTSGRHNPSLANMLRIGFEIAYERPNWVWRR